jgi:putative transcriptional regulator
MIRHHPSDATLTSHAAGHLPALHGRVLAVHLASCPRCRDEVHRMEEVGGALLATLPPAALHPDALAHMLARLDDTRFAPPPPNCDSLRAPSAQTEGENSLPSPATIIEAFATGRWWWLGPGIRLMPLAPRDASGTRLDLIRVAPGVAMPGHGHTGAEMACILQGGYADETGHYNEFDIAEGDPSLEHTPIASPGPDCICLIATTGRLRAHTWLARLIQPLVGV